MNFLEEYKEQFAPNASMHKIISTVDTTKDRDVNVALLVSIKVRVLELKEAISYLKQNFSEKYKNQILIFEIVKNMTKPMLLDQNGLQEQSGKSKRQNKKHIHSIQNRAQGRILN